MAKRAENQEDECGSLAYQAWVNHLHGDHQAAVAAFQQAEALEREIDPDEQYLYSQRGVRHADYLHRTGDANYARRVTEANLAICERCHWRDNWSRSCRVLGDLDADVGQHRSARAYYDKALKTARDIVRRDVLVEALLARGRWYARHMHNSAAAFSDLNEALSYTTESAYRIYEADTRVALAWAHLAAGDFASAKAEAARARSMSEGMGYYWGQVDAAEVLTAIEGTNQTT
jgi:tetratricopeptide (TPR) repeat protein